MLKRNIVLILSASVIVLFIIIVGILEVTFIGKGYNEIFKANWDISLPSGYEQVYEKDSGSSFLGDGERFHIFRYKYAEKVKQCIDWYKGTSVVLEAEVAEVLNSLDIPEAVIPNFNVEYKYYIKRNSDSSKLYFILNEEMKKLYIIENIF